MADTQAKSIRDILLAALRNYNAAINLDTSGRAYTQLVTPVYEALLPDMFESEVEEYLIAALKEQHPSLELQDGDAIIDLMIRPLQLLLEPMKRELNLLRKRQSVRYPGQLTDEDAEDLAANFFITRRRGNFSTGIVRVFFATPTFISVNRNLRFSTNSGLVFVPAKQEFISAGTVASQRIGNLYYADISVIAEELGSDYNVPAGSITNADGLTNYSSVTNPFDFSLGADSESKEDLLARTEASLTERSLVTRKGITARLNNDFSTIRQMFVVGHGDPEMKRDVLTGYGSGKLLASGVSVIFGRYVFMLTGYEDAGAGSTLPASGDRVKMNFWKFMYVNDSVEDGVIQDVIYSSYGDAPDSPTIHIFLLKNTPTTQQPIRGALPGTFPGVFISVFTDTEISVSGIPEGLYDTGGALPLRLPSNEVHIGGKYDVWVAAQSLSPEASLSTIYKSPFLDQRITVHLEGEPSSQLTGLYPLNRVATSYYVVEVSRSSLVLESVVTNQSGIKAFIHAKQGNNITLVCRTGEFAAGDTLTDSYGNTATVLALSVTNTEIKKGSCVSITSSGFVDTYYVVDTESNYLIVHKNVEESGFDLTAYTYSNTGLQDIFNPNFQVFPELSEYTTGLQTYVGRSDVYVPHDLIEFGVQSGDTLEILSGEDRGRYSISDVTYLNRQKTKVDLGNTLGRTNSNIRYRVLRTTEAVSAPLISVLPSGMNVIGDGETLDIPYAKSVGAYAVGAFSGTMQKFEGVNGFVLPNLGEAFKGTGAYIADITKQADPAVLSQFSNSKFDDCISNGCKECTGIPIVVSVTVDGLSSGYSNVKMYVTGATDTIASQYLTDLRSWFKSVINAFLRGHNSQTVAVADDLDAFVDAFSLFTLGEPTDPNEHLITQLEMCLPKELFDGSNNVYVALPEIDWGSAFASVSTFEQAMVDFLAGDLSKETTALSMAKPGDALKVQQGANSGEYVIDKVFNLPWYTDTSIQTETTINANGTASTSYAIMDDRTFPITFVVIKGEFAEETFANASDFFQASIPSVANILPVPPSYPATIQTQYISGVNRGTIANPFSVLEDIYSVLFKSLASQGFDLPDEFNFIPGPTLEKIVKKLFSPYITGVRSPQQTTRMLFQDPVDITVYSPQTRKEIEWLPEIKSPATLVATLPISLPITPVAGKEVTVYYTLNDTQDAVTLTGTLSAEAGTTTSINTLVDLIQEAVDPLYEYVKIGWQADTMTSSFITVQSLFGGENSYVKVKAVDGNDGFYCLGFDDLTSTNTYVDFDLSQHLLSNPIIKATNLGRSQPSKIGITHSTPGTIWALIKQGVGFYQPIGSTINISIGLVNTSVTSITGAKVIANVSSQVVSGVVVIIPDSSVGDIDAILTEELDYIYITGPDEITQIGNPSSTQKVENRVSPLIGAAQGGTDGLSIDLQSILPYAYSQRAGGGTRLASATLYLEFDTPSATFVVGSYSVSIDESVEIGVRVVHANRGDAAQVFLTLNSDVEDLQAGLANSPNSIIDAGITELVYDTEVEVSTTLTVDSPDVLVSTETGSSIDLLDGLQAADLAAIEQILENPASTIKSASANIAPILNSFISNTNTRFYPTNTGLRLLLLSGDFLAVTTVYTPTVNYDYSLFDFLVNQSSTGLPTNKTNTYAYATSNGTTAVAEGSSAVGSVPVVKEILPHNGTRFDMTQYSEKRQLIVDIQDNEDYFYSVIPRKHANLELALTDLPRDLLFTSHYLNAQACTMVLTGEGDSVFSSDVLPGDLLYVHEQKFILSNAGVTSDPFSTKKDRILFAVHNDQRKELTLLNTAGNFLYPEGHNPSNNSIPDRNAVREGDVVYFEQTGQVVTVTHVSENVLRLSGNTGTPNKETVLYSGRDLTLTGTTAVSVSHPFTAADVGRYLVLYGSENNEVDGTYTIDSVSNGVATLDADTEVTEANLHWAICKPGFTVPGNSAVGGYSDTAGVVPVRIYSGIPSKFEIGERSVDILRTRSTATVLYGSSDAGPVRGVKQPFKVLRPNMCRMTAEEMLNQGTEGNLYYFDVPSTTLTPTYDLNIEENTQSMPVYTTYTTSGYTFEVDNTALTFSTREQTKLVITGGVLSVTSGGSLSEIVLPENRTVEIQHYTSDTVSQLQLYLENQSNRILVADPMARHFLPGFISVEVPVDFGDTDLAKEGVVDYINSLSATEDLLLSKIEKQLHSYDLDLYNHPVFMYCTTTDLDRNIIVTRSNNKISDDTLLHNGTGRTTTFIALESNIVIGGE